MYRTKRRLYLNYQNKWQMSLTSSRLKIILNLSIIKFKLIQIVLDLVFKVINKTWEISQKVLVATDVSHLVWSVLLNWIQRAKKLLVIELLAFQMWIPIRISMMPQVLTSVKSKMRTQLMKWSTLCQLLIGHYNKHWKRVNELLMKKRDINFNWLKKRC